jgi:acetyl esterase
LLDVFFPSALGEGETLPAIVWVHGGAWVSGGRWQMSEYASILAANGYAVAVVSYSLAPEATYPTALNQVSRALDFLSAHGSALHVDSARLILAGDSAGAQIAAQVANAVTSSDYAREIGISAAMDAGNLRGVVLFSGAYDLALVNLNGVTGLFLRSVLWAYTGTANFATDSRFASASVIHYLSSSFPPTFVSAGDADPLLAHSLALAESLTALEVDVDQLFFGIDGPSGHNYQFNLDADTGRAALGELLTFLGRVSRKSSDG